MEELELGKIYLIYSALNQTEDFNPSPYSTFVFGTKDPYLDIEDTGITIVNGTLVVYLGKCIVNSKHFKMYPIIEEVIYFKLLIEDEIVYVLNDGYACFKRINHDTSIS